MGDGPDSIVLRQLRNMDDKLDRILHDMHDVKVRMTGVEEGLSGVHRRMDRMEGRLDKVERRLDLVNT